jgi:hypothetical protein
MPGTTDGTPTEGSALLSLVELRRHLLRQASTLSVRARRMRARGDVAGGARTAEEAGRLLAIAQDMGRRRRPDEPG